MIKKNKKRILVFSDSFSGTGHQNRAELICDKLINSGHKVLYISSACNNNKLSFYKILGYGDSINNPSDYKAIKKRRISALERFLRINKKFDLVFIEHFPIGKLYLKEEFKLLYSAYKSVAKFYCLYRDIIDNEDMAVMKEFVSILNNCFDGIFVFADSSITKLENKLVSKLNLTPKYLGYLDPCPRNQILVFGGGGKYNFDFYNKTIKVLLNLRRMDNWEIRIYTGSLMDEKLLKILKKLAKQRKNMVISKYCKNMQEELRKSFVTISTLGYNTFVDLYRENNFNIIVLLRRNNEQLMRSKTLQNIKSKASVIDLNVDYSKELERTLVRLLEAKPDMRGLDQFSYLIEKL